MGVIALAAPIAAKIAGAGVTAGTIAGGTAAGAGLAAGGKALTGGATQGGLNLGALFGGSVPQTGTTLPQAYYQLGNSARQGVNSVRQLGGGAPNADGGDGFWDGFADYFAGKGDMPSLPGDGGGPPEPNATDLGDKISEAQKRAKNLQAIFTGLEDISTAFPGVKDVRAVQHGYSGPVNMLPNTGQIGLQRLLEALAVRGGRV